MSTILIPATAALAPFGANRSESPFVLPTLAGRCAAPRVANASGAASVFGTTAVMAPAGAHGDPIVRVRDAKQAAPPRGVPR